MDDVTGCATHWNTRIRNVGYGQPILLVPTVEYPVQRPFAHRLVTSAAVERRDTGGRCCRRHWDGRPRHTRKTMWP